MKLAVCILLAKAQSLLWSWVSRSRPPDPSSSMLFFIDGENIKNCLTNSVLHAVFLNIYIYFYRDIGADVWIRTAYKIEFCCFYFYMYNVIFVPLS